MTELEKIRQQIDETDEGLLQLFLKRMSLSDEVAKYKKENNLPTLNKQREREILADVTKKAGDSEMYAHRLFTTLFELSRARQTELMSQPSQVETMIESALAAADDTFPKNGTVACQGVEGANSQQACDKLLPRGNIVYVKTFEAVFDAVASGLCKFGVVPIENSSAGSVRSVYDLLRTKNMPIVAGTRLCIQHELMAKPGTRLEDVKEIYSHEQAISQCTGFLSGLKNVRVIPCDNTAVAAKNASQTDSVGVAAICSHRCAELYGLEVLKDDIRDSDNNYTRFACIAKKPVIYPSANRISLVIACDNKPGALYDILSMPAAIGVNMTKLESCPVPGKDFEFIFFIELAASVNEPGVKKMLGELERTCRSFTFLGSYAEF